MAGNLNKVMLIGHVGKEPEIRSSPDGARICNLSLATSEHYKDKVTGERRSKTEWHRVFIINDRIIDVIDRFVRKGSLIYVEGQLQTRKWTDKEGSERYYTEVLITKFRGDITLLDKSGDNKEEQNEPNLADAKTKPQYEKTQDYKKPDNYVDDEIPF